MDEHGRMNSDAVSAVLSGGKLVKIDGLREPRHAAAAAMAGADMIGFIFAPARRQVTPAVARECIHAAREGAAGRQTLAVGVFVNATVDEIEEVVMEAGLDLVQLHGVESPSFVERLAVPAIKVFRPRANTDSAVVLEEIEGYRSTHPRPVAYLIDGYDEAASGGTGVRADWELAASINRATHVMLAGGLNPSNVETAIRQVHPLGVDVSSGVEVRGEKDAGLIADFVRAAKEAFGD